MGEGVVGRMLLPVAGMLQKLEDDALRIDRYLDRIDPPFRRKAWLWFHPKAAKRDVAATIECTGLILERVRMLTGKESNG